MTTAPPPEPAYLAATEHGRHSHIVDEARTRQTSYGEVPLTLCGHLTHRVDDENLPPCLRCERAWLRLETAA